MKHAILLLTLVFVAAMAACGLKQKEIPLEVFVKVFVKMGADDEFRKKYQKPEDAPISEIEVFTAPSGFSGEDFIYTMSVINKDEKMRKLFKEMADQAHEEEAMRQLNERDTQDSLK